jgi:hypothetical protein
MHNLLSPLFNLTSDQIAMFSLGVGIVAMIAAGLAAYFACKSPTAADLKRVEDNIGEANTHLENVHSKISSMDKIIQADHKKDQLIARAQRVSVSVEGNGGISLPLEVVITLKESDNQLTRVGLCNNNDIELDSVKATKRSELTYAVSIDRQLSMNWYGFGNLGSMHNRVRLQMRIYMLFEDIEVWRSIAVEMISTSNPNMFTVIGRG